MPLDPQVAHVLQALAALEAPPLHTLSVADARAAAMSPGMLALAGEPIEVGNVKDITIPVTDDVDVAARVYTPVGEGPHPVVVFLHGGGWVICGLDTHDNAARAICRDAAAVVVSVDYRMAPEHRFPTAALDSFAATKWIAENASAFDADGSRLAVCGDSAGGNLSAVVTQMARDAGGPSIAFAALIYPAVDMTDRSGSMVENATGYFLEEESMVWFMNHYLDTDDHGDPLASPLLNPNLADLPSCFVATCEFDPLRDQGEAYAAALRAAGVDAEVKRYDGQIHAIINMTGVIDGGRQLLADVSSRLRNALHPAR